jgi:hypothetical protein
VSTSSKFGDNFWDTFSPVDGNGAAIRAGG